MSKQTPPPQVTVNTNFPPITGAAVLSLIDDILLASGWMKGDKGFYPKHWESPLMAEYGMEPDAGYLAHYSRENAIRFEVRFREWQAKQ